MIVTDAQWRCDRCPRTLEFHVHAPDHSVIRCPACDPECRWCATESV